MKVFVRTDIGKVRALNEDSYYLPAAGERFCAVADGMGGHNAGEVASALAVQVFADELRSCVVLSAPALHKAVDRANAVVYAKSLENEQCSGMGTTFTALTEQNGNVHIAHVGDSRCYLVRNGAIMRLTLDHTLVEEMVLKGLISPNEARHHPKRNYITRALGTAERVEVDLIQVEKRGGDVFFLCSDGLSNHVEDGDILNVISSALPWQDKLEKLVGMALENGGSDNITAMIAVFEEEHQ